MDEYNPMNYHCEPADEQPKQQPAYDPTQYRPFDAEAYRRQEAARERGYAPDPYAAPQPPKKPKKDRTVLKIVALVAVVALLGSIGGSLLTKAIDRINDPADAGVKEISEPETEEAGPAYEVGKHKLPETLGSYDTGKSLTPAEVYELTVDSVVGIRTESTVNAFGQEAVSASAGSGFILSEDGYVITNAHVVSGAQTIHVDLFNGESYEAQLVGADSSFDIAVLKVEAEGLTPVSVGNSDQLKVGEEVVAIGNPLGELTFTMTNGILSALDREINTDGNPQNMIQTNAAINSGNSGGPLFDMDGNVIGVTTAKYSGSTNSGTTIEGLGFAIPINTALKVAYDLTEYGYVKGQAFLGITVKTLDSQTASYYSLPVGPRVEAINEGSCAEKAGLQVGDIIIKFHGVETATHPELLAALRKVQAGDTVDMTVYRAGKEVELSVTLDEKPRQEELDAQVEAFENQNQGTQPEVQPSPDDSQQNPYYYYEFPFNFGN